MGFAWKGCSLPLPFGNAFPFALVIHFELGIRLLSLRRGETRGLEPVERPLVDSEGGLSTLGVRRRRSFKTFSGCSGESEIEFDRLASGVRTVAGAVVQSIVLSASGFEENNSDREHKAL